MYRQVLIEGSGERISEKESEDYFHSRPHESQVAAWVSKQSTPIENRTKLNQQFEKALNRFENQELPKPDYWGGGTRFWPQSRTPKFGPDYYS